MLDEEPWLRRQSKPTGIIGGIKLSGPKKSAYQIQREQEEAIRRRLEEERKRKEEERRRLEQERRERERQENLRAISENKTVLKEWNGNLSKLKDRWIMLGASGEELDLCDALVSQIQFLISRKFDESKLETVKKERQLLADYMEENKSIIHQLLEKTNQMENAQSEKLSQALDDIIKQADQQKSIINKTIQEPGKADETVKIRELWNKIYEEIKEMEEQRAFSKKYYTFIESAKKMLQNYQKYKSYVLLLDYYSGEFQSLRKKFKNYMYDYNRYKEPFFEAYNSYISLCSMVGEEAKAFAFEPEKAADMLDNLQAEIKRLEEIALEQRKEAYIRNAIAEVMEEMGYEILASKDITKKSGKQIKKSIFKYGEGSGIQVIDDNGSITMEVVGFNRGNDRLASDEETDFLLDEQKDFCNSFAIMEEKLKKKGVNRVPIMHMQPAKEHAKLINLDNYNSNKENITLVNERTAKKKRAASVQKQRAIDN